eukprot:TRINITY_DN2013_c0_g1_i1.p1 TRINITY_DN2013_c0_g1~~TRINITY_DN2013_c0_g1_i1.p1  ORF type:complete len:508 (+),score=61.22 TRINITY_DN2013_c0_g1_i1:64-1587(+)
MASFTLPRAALACLFLGRDVVGSIERQPETQQIKPGPTCYGTGSNTCMALPESRDTRARRPPLSAMSLSSKDNMLLQWKRSSTRTEANAHSSSACCDRCHGHQYCSPVSKNCYDSKRKDYYKACGGESKDDGDDGSAPAPAPAPAPTDSCCGKCVGRSFCSPISNNCYDIKQKDYYKSCRSESSDSGDGGLAPPPAPPAEGGLTPPPPPPSNSCCGKCAGRPFCSPVSGSCYDTQRKPYYLSCAEMVRGELVWSDEFNVSGAVDSSKWAHYNGPNPNNRELQYYTDSANNSNVQDGVLSITAKCEEYEDKSSRHHRTYHYTSARLVTRDLAAWGPGHRIEVRAKFPTGKGTWPAIWMLPAEFPDGKDWPRSGEIDIMESVGCTPQKVYGTVHTGAFNHLKNTQVGRSLTSNYGEWHNYTLDWTDTYMKWLVDGEHYHTFAPNVGSHDEWPFHGSFYLILNVAVGGSWGGFCLQGRRPSCSDPKYFGNDQVMQVDYVRVYELLEGEAQ